MKDSIVKFLKTPPRYMISPAAQKKSVWTPEVFQMVLGHPNPNYINSVWLGVFWNVGILPYRTLREFGWALFNFRFHLALLSLLVLPVSTFWLFCMGICGKLSAHTIPLDYINQSVILTPEQSQEAVGLGFNDVLIDVNGAQANKLAMYGGKPI